jgi:hypothetical protein
MSGVSTDTLDGHCNDATIRRCRCAEGTGLPSEFDLTPLTSGRLGDRVAVYTAAKTYGAFCVPGGGAFPFGQCHSTLGGVLTSRGL